MEPILFSTEGQVGIIILNRPQKYNSFSRQMAMLFQEVLDDCASNKQIRAVYLTGQGKAFCAGQDLSELTGGNGSDLQKLISEVYNPIVTRIRNLKKPVLCAVNGVAAGAGANIALCCDIVVAAQSASFVQAFSKVGLIPDSGGTFTLPRLIGFQKASALMMLGDAISAQEAERMGMLYKVFENDLFGTESMKIAIKLSEMPTRSLSFIKEALNASMSNSWDEQLNLEERLQFASAQTYDYKEGVNAFLEKRVPHFRGE